MMYCFAKMCCLCLQPHLDLNNLDEVDHYGLTGFEKLVVLFPGFEELLKKSIPNYICKKCKRYLSKLYKFRQNCLKSYKLLHSYVSKLESRDLASTNQQVEVVVEEDEEDPDVILIKDDLILIKEDMDECLKNMEIYIKVEDNNEQSVQEQSPGEEEEDPDVILIKDDLILIKEDMDECLKNMEIYIKVEDNNEQSVQEQSPGEEEEECSNIASNGGYSPVQQKRKRTRELPKKVSYNEDYNSDSMYSDSEIYLTKSSRRKKPKKPRLNDEQQNKTVVIPENNVFAKDLTTTLNNIITRLAADNTEPLLKPKEFKVKFKNSAGNTENLSIYQDTDTIEVRFTKENKMGYLRRCRQGDTFVVTHGMFDREAETVLPESEADRQPDVWKCTICQKTFRSCYELTKHKNDYMNFSDVSCKICDKRFEHVTDLKRHINVHNFPIAPTIPTTPEKGKSPSNNSNCSNSPRINKYCEMQVMLTSPTIPTTPEKGKSSSNNSNCSNSPRTPEKGKSPSNNSNCSNSPRTNKYCEMQVMLTSPTISTTPEKGKSSSNNSNCSNSPRTPEKGKSPSNNSNCSNSPRTNKYCEMQVMLTSPTIPTTPEKGKSSSNNSNCSNSPRTPEKGKSPSNNSNCSSSPRTNKYCEMQVMLAELPEMQIKSERSSSPEYEFHLSDDTDDEFDADTIILGALDNGSDFDENSSRSPSPVQLGAEVMDFLQRDEDTPNNSQTEAIPQKGNHENSPLQGKIDTNSKKACPLQEKAEAKIDKKAGRIYVKDVGTLQEKVVAQVDKKSKGICPENVVFVRGKAETLTNKMNPVNGGALQGRAENLKTVETEADKTSKKICPENVETLQEKIGSQIDTNSNKLHAGPLQDKAEAKIDKKAGRIYLKNVETLQDKVVAQINKKTEGTSPKNVEVLQGNAETQGRAENVKRAERLNTVETEADKSSKRICLENVETLQGKTETQMSKISPENGGTHQRRAESLKTVQTETDKTCNRICLENVEALQGKAEAQTKKNPENMGSPQGRSKAKVDKAETICTEKLKIVETKLNKNSKRISPANVEGFRGWAVAQTNTPENMGPLQERAETKVHKTAERIGPENAREVEKPKIVETKPNKNSKRIYPENVEGFRGWAAAQTNNPKNVGPLQERAETKVDKKAERIGPENVRKVETKAEKNVEALQGNAESQTPENVRPLQERPKAESISPENVRRASRQKRISSENVEGKAQTPKKMCPENVGPPQRRAERKSKKMGSPKKASQDSAPNGNDFFQEKLLKIVISRTEVDDFMRQKREASKKIC